MNYKFREIEIDEEVFDLLEQIENLDDREVRKLRDLCSKDVNSEDLFRMFVKRDKKGYRLNSVYHTWLDLGFFKIINCKNNIELNIDDVDLIQSVLEKGRYKNLLELEEKIPAISGEIWLNPMRPSKRLENLMIKTYKNLSEKNRSL